MSTKIPLYAAQLGEEDEETGIFAMSFVADPAVERNFVALNKARTVKLVRNTHKQILTGVVLVPDQRIYRNDTQLGEYNMYFTADDIVKIRNKMMRTGIALSTTTHEHEKPLTGHYLVECWTVEDPARDKSVALGLGKLPKGSLCASYQITDPVYWRTQVMTGKVKGFSLEGLFNFNKIAMSKTARAAVRTKKAPAKGGMLPAFLSLFSHIVKMEGDTVADVEEMIEEVAEVDNTDSGEAVTKFYLADEGGEVEAHTDGYCTLGGEQMPEGPHLLDDGAYLVVDADGFIVETVEEITEDEIEEAAVELQKVQRKVARLAKNKKAAGPRIAKLSDGKKPAAGKRTELQQLKARIAELEKSPSTTKVVQKFNSQSDKPATMQQRATAAIAARNAK